MAKKHKSARPDRRTVWHPIKIPKRVAEARKKYKPRHLADLLCAIGISYYTARGWARNAEHFPEWLPACEGVPRPYRHELDMLRYVNKTNIAAVQKRMREIGLHAAVDEIIGAARVEGEARRKATRIARYGHDPVPDKRLTREERQADKPRRAMYREKRQVRNKKLRRGRNRREQKIKMKQLRLEGKALIEVRRQQRVRDGFKSFFDVDVRDWPLKTPEQQAAEALEAKRERQREYSRRYRQKKAGEKVRVEVIDYAGP